MRSVFAFLHTSLPAAMGEWDLQALSWNDPRWSAALLQGPLGPEALKHNYGLAETDALELYRTLYVYSTGFFQVRHTTHFMMKGFSC